MRFVCLVGFFSSFSLPDESSCVYLHKKQEAAYDFRNMLRTKLEDLNSFDCFGSVLRSQIYNYLSHNSSEAIRLA